MKFLHIGATRSKRFFVAGFYCHEAKLVVELDGKIHENQTVYDGWNNPPGRFKVSCGMEAGFQANPLKYKSIFINYRANEVNVFRPWLFEVK